MRLAYLHSEDVVSVALPLFDRQRGGNPTQNLKVMIISDRQYFENSQNLQDSPNFGSGKNIDVRDDTEIVVTQSGSFREGFYVSFGACLEVQSRSGLAKALWSGGFVLPRPHLRCC